MALILLDSPARDIRCPAQSEIPFSRYNVISLNPTSKDSQSHFGFKNREVGFKNPQCQTLKLQALISLAKKRKQESLELDSVVLAVPTRDDKVARVVVRGEAPLTQQSEEDKHSLLEQQRQTKQDFRQRRPPPPSAPLNLGLAMPLKPLQPEELARLVSLLEQQRQQSNKNKVEPELEQKSAESVGEYVKRLKQYVEKQCSEIQVLLSRNAILSKEVAASHSWSEHIESFRRDFQEASRQLELARGGHLDP